jgi:hypothetical protein
MDDYRLATLVLGAFYACVELIKWIYNKSQPALNNDEARKLNEMYAVVSTKDSTGRPLIYRDSADNTALQKETVTELRAVIRELAVSVDKTNTMLQQFLLRELDRTK